MGIKNLRLEAGALPKGSARLCTILLSKKAVVTDEVIYKNPPVIEGMGKQEIEIIFAVVIYSEEKHGKKVSIMSETAKRHLGQQVGNYRLTRWLGQGGFADVYLGEHVYLKTQSAIKMLHVQLSEQTLQDFLHEAQVIAGLDHPNIVRVFDYGIEKGTPFLVMSYAPNGSIRRLAPRGTRVQPEQILPLVQQIASALDYAHQRKLIHRDVKQENILLGQQQEVLLSDFGLVVVAQSSSSQTAQQMAGTVPYMAPEQLQGRVRFASDQYSLGIVTYEWLCGERPFTGSFTAIASQHLLVPPPSLCQRVPGLSPLVEQVVFRALAKDPAQRYESVTAFANAFRDACQQATNGSMVADISKERIVTAEQAAMPSGGPSNPPQNVPPADATPNQAQQADAFDPTTSIATPVPPVSPPLPSLTTPPGLMQQATSTPPRRSARRSGVLWRAVLLVVLVALIVVGAGIWYSAAHFPGRRPDQRQSMSPIAGQSPLTSTAQGTAQVTASAMPTTHVTPTGTTNGNAPVGATGTPTQAPKQTPTPAPDCLQGSSSHLTFTSVLGLGNHFPRTMTLTNCGGSTMTLS
jgi:serine/threonine protein kinase